MGSATQLAEDSGFSLDIEVSVAKQRALGAGGVVLARRECEGLLGAVPTAFLVPIVLKTINPTVFTQKAAGQ